ncbi:MAG: antibiotic biosynthesis monooxygenase [Rubrobacteraceae bacterium]
MGKRFKTEVFGGSNDEDPPVTAIVVKKPKLGLEKEFEEFTKGVLGAASRFPGYLSSEVFRPESGGQEYRIVLKFNHQSSLQNWEDSPERAAWHARAGELAGEEQRRRVLTGLETWFTLPGQEGRPPPPRHKMALLTWLVVFPLITTIFYLIEPLLGWAPLPLRTMTTTLIMIPVMFYLVMPAITRVFDTWLYPELKDRRGKAQSR